MSSHSLGWVLCLILLVSAPTAYPATRYYVSDISGDDLNDGTSWAQAKKTIQAAVNVASNNDLVLVTNGIYDAGGKVTPGYALTNRVCVTNSAIVRSVNGPANTFIVGAGPEGPAAVRCVYLALNAILDGFTLTNGHTLSVSSTNWDFEKSGAGVFVKDSGGTITNCIFTGNHAAYGGGGSHGGYVLNSTYRGNTATNFGGGVQFGSLYSCAVLSNSAGSSGGGVRGATTMSNCTVVGNSAGSGGGTYLTLSVRNCTLSNNVATSQGGGAFGGALSNCTIRGNFANIGGGTYGSLLFNSTLQGNHAALRGGGANGSTSYNCTLIFNTAADTGGGANGGQLFHCLIGANTASNDGGGAYQSFLYNCVFTNNVAVNDGGGIYGSTIVNCVLARNSAKTGGGIFGGSLYNCIVWSNFASLAGANCDIGSTVSYSCTTPAPAGLGNVSNDPKTVNFGAGDFHLTSNSPCVEAGINSGIFWTEDLDGNPRLRNIYVDIGAYEYQGEAIALFWLQKYSLPTNGSATHMHSDGDGMDNWEEYMADTHPTEATSYLGLASFSRSATGPGVVLTWQSATSRTYGVERMTNAVVDSTYETVFALNGIHGQAGQTAATDTTAQADSMRAYRVHAGP
jgi:predicted outer membrane repeat protein